jgi:hypothetical protein
VAINDVLIVMEMDWLPEIESQVLLALAHIKNHKTGNTGDDHVRYASGVMANSKRDATGSYDGRKVTYAS